MFATQYHRIILIVLALTICLSSAAPTIVASNQLAHPSPQVVFPTGASSLESSASIPVDQSPRKPALESPSMLKQVITAPKVVLGFLHAYSGLSSSSRLTNQYSSRLRPHRRLPRPHPVSRASSVSIVK
ncbi:hypothetical protein BJ165DRAFT_1608464 [Panaeolus papilionaceus]|nr:hypothetical protein BJ165DRAFT_1608464 [Panaeolus papilionaceus]